MVEKETLYISETFFARENDTNQVRSEFGLKMYADKFYEIKHISQTVHHNELAFYMEILNTWKYILVTFQDK
jgi:hypothetical protein